MTPSAAQPTDKRRLQLKLELTAGAASDRLTSRLRAERPLALATGDWTDGYVGKDVHDKFNFRQATNLPRLYAVQAYGSIRDDPSGVLLDVRFRRNRFASAMIWFMRVFTILLVGAALLASTRQPAFLVFGGFAAVGGGVVLWLNRERDSDRQALRRFLLEAFAAK